MDVNSLYTNIDHKEGTDACYKNWKRRKIKLFHQTLWRIAFYQLWNLTFSSFATLLIYKKGRAMGTQWLLIMQSYLCLWTCLKHHFLMTFTKNWKESLNIATFYQWHIFHLDRRWKLVEEIFSILSEIQWNKEYEVSYKIWNITIYQNYQFLRHQHHPKSTNLICHCLFKTQRRSHQP